VKIEWGHDITNLDLEDNGYPLDESKEMALFAFGLVMLSAFCHEIYDRYFK
jgi:hypothetical protein